VDIWLPDGTEGLNMTYGQTQREVNKVMASHGFSEEAGNYLWREFEGDDHSERSWRDRLEIPLQFLLKK
jgi:enterochelin esterase-like enzyme